MCARHNSGTTGSPKGVEVTHENIVSGIAALQTYTEDIGIDVSAPFWIMHLPIFVLASGTVIVGLGIDGAATQ